MPVHIGRDKKGYYYQWGNQKKYYFKTEQQRKIAHINAIKQGYAIRMRKLI